MRCDNSFMTNIPPWRFVTGGLWWNLITQMDPLHSSIQPGWRPAARRVVRGWNICSELEMINAGVTRNKQPITQLMASPSTVNTVNCSTAYLPSSQPLISTSHCLHFTFTFTSYCACHVCQFDNVRSVCVSLYISNSNTIYYLRLLCWISHLNHHISGKQMGVY